MADQEGNGGPRVDLLTVLQALTRAISALFTNVNALQASNADLQRRVEALERRNQQ